MSSIAFFGTPQLAVYVLEELEQRGILPSIVVTPPDKPAGRGLLLTPSPVKMWAQTHDIPVLQTTSLKDRHTLPELANTEWDLFIVAAYTLILPPWVLALPKKQVLNVHPSLLPQLRGPSPVRSALLFDARDAIGVSVMVVDNEIDHGPLVAQATVELPTWPVEGQVLDEVLFREGGRLLAEVIPLWLRDGITPDEQDHTKATFTRKFEKKDGEIDLTGDPYQNYLRFCAVDGWPGAYMFIDEPQSSGTPLRHRLKITHATYDGRRFTIHRVIPEGKKERLWHEWLRTHPSVAIS